MQTLTGEKAGSDADASPSNRALIRLSRLWDRSAHWLSVQIGPREDALPRQGLLVACAVIFLLALGVRLLHWQDARGTGMSAIARRYESEAQRMRKDGGILFPRTPADAGDARLILHPPGYSAFIAVIYAAVGDSPSMVLLVQVVLDALSAILVLLIAAELFNRRVAIIVGTLIALSPHFAHYSLWFSPDTLPILPILVAVYLIVKAGKSPRTITIAAAGAMLGFSCWLRANGMLLAFFMAAMVAVLVDRGKRVASAGALVITTILVISPITLRNWIIYHRFIPISVDGGLALVEGIAAYDEQNRFGMPRLDAEALNKDPEWHNRPDYAGNLWSPDGVDRDAYRFRRGLEVIRSNPFWFAGVMLRRGAFMLRYDSPSKAVWPFTTASVPPVAAEPGFGHDIAPTDRLQASWSLAGSELFAGGVTIAPEAQTARLEDQNSLRITGDASEFGDQFASAPIAVERRTDYLLTLSADLINGPAAVKVTTVDRRIALASAKIPGNRVKTARKAEKQPADGSAEAAPKPDSRPNEISLPFASGNRSEVLLVVSNNGTSTPTSPPIVEINQCTLHNLGPTPHQWTRFIRPPLRALQRNLYSTPHMLPLVITGAILAIVAGRRRETLILTAVPAYYLLVHSAVHTEYRYILAIHYFLFSFAAIALTCAASLLLDAARNVSSSLKRTPGSPIDEVVQTSH